MRRGHTESNNTAALTVSEAECNRCGTHLFVLIRTIVPSCAMLVQRSLLWLKVVFLMWLGWSTVIKLSHAGIAVSVMRSEAAALRWVFSPCRMDSQFIFKFEGNAEPHSSQMTANWTTKKVQNNKDSATQEQAWKEKKKEVIYSWSQTFTSIQGKVTFNHSTDFILRNSTFGKLVRTYVDEEGLALLDGQSKIWKK